VINLKTATAFGRTILKPFVRAGESVENYPMGVVVAMHESAFWHESEVDTDASISRSGAVGAVAAAYSGLE
jgi:hypothetical protein